MESIISQADCLQVIIPEDQVDQTELRIKLLKKILRMVLPYSHKL